MKSPIITQIVAKLSWPTLTERFWLLIDRVIAGLITSILTIIILKLLG
jgi:hypothetical protein